MLVESNFSIVKRSRPLLRFLLEFELLSWRFSRGAKKNEEIKQPGIRTYSNPDSFAIVAQFSGLRTFNFSIFNRTMEKYKFIDVIYFSDPHNAPSMFPTPFKSAKKYLSDDEKVKTLKACETNNDTSVLHTF